MPLTYQEQQWAFPLHTNHLKIQIKTNKHKLTGINPKAVFNITSLSVKWCVFLCCSCSEASLTGEKRKTSPYFSAKSIRNCESFFILVHTFTHLYRTLMTILAVASILTWIMDVKCVRVLINEDNKTEEKTCHFCFPKARAPPGGKGSESGPLLVHHSTSYKKPSSMTHGNSWWQQFSSIRPVVNLNTYNNRCDV